MNDDILSYGDFLHFEYYDEQPNVSFWAMFKYAYLNDDDELVMRLYIYQCSDWWCLFKEKDSYTSNVNANIKFATKYRYDEMVARLI